MTEHSFSDQSVADAPDICSAWAEEKPTLGQRLMRRLRRVSFINRFFFRTKVLPGYYVVKQFRCESLDVDLPSLSIKSTDRVNVEEVRVNGHVVKKWMSLTLEIPMSGDPVATIQMRLRKQI